MMPNAPDAHDEAAALAYRDFYEGLECLRRAVRIFRGPGLQSSPEAMRTEASLTRAIETLIMNGFAAPRAP